MSSTVIAPSPLKIKIPTREDVHRMMTSTPVAITIVICLTILALGALGAVVYLAITGNDTAAVAALIGAVMAAYNARLSTRIGETKQAIEEVKYHQQQGQS